MKRALIILAAPLLLTACMDKNPIDENAGRVWDWYLSYMANQWEAPVPDSVVKECGDAVLAGKSNDPACEQFAAHFTKELNSGSTLNEPVETQDWYSKNFWAKWMANYEKRKVAIEEGKQRDAEVAACRKLGGTAFRQCMKKVNEKY